MIDLPEMPWVIARLRRDKRGYPIPWFVAWIGGEPDFRVIEPGRLQKAVRQNRCWICGGRLGRMKVFVIGPMCAINRISSEPPSHLHCADWAARACPFLTRPRMSRSPRPMPADAATAPGIMLERNPGVTLLWGTLRYRVKPASGPAGPGVLFDIGRPEIIRWYAEGRAATREEVGESIKGGFPNLLALAQAEGLDAVDALFEKLEDALPLLPKEAA